MGGKGGGGGNSTPLDPMAQAKSIYANEQAMLQQPAGYGNDWNSTFKHQFDDNRKNYVNPTTGAWDEALWRQNKGGAGFDWSKNLFDLYYPNQPAPAPAAAAAPAPAPAAPEPAAPAPAAPAAPAPNPIDPGGAIDQPSTGSELGGAVLDPPKYWVGGLESYDKTKKGDSLKTTQS